MKLSFQDQSCCFPARYVLAWENRLLIRADVDGILIIHFNFSVTVYDAQTQ